MAATAAVLKPQAPMTNGSIVEGLFVRALKAEGPFADELRAVGINVARLESQYPQAAFLEGMRIAAKYICPKLSEPEAQRELGRRFIVGWQATILGGVIAGALSLLGPDALMRRFPKASAVSSREVDTEAILEAPNQWLLRSATPGKLPHFVAGTLEAFMRRMRIDPKIEVLRDDAKGMEIRVRW